jgi:hypothetical protein
MPRINSPERINVCKMSAPLFSVKIGKRSLLQKSERRKATKKNIQNQCLFSSSLLRKSERRKESKEHRKSQFCLIFTF